MIDNLQLIHAAGNRWHCDQSESNAMKAKESAEWVVAFYDKNGCSSETIYAGLSVSCLYAHKRKGPKSGPTIMVNLRYLWVIDLKYKHLKPLIKR